MWQVGLLIRLPRPLARAVKRLSVVPCSTKMVLTFRFVDISAIVVLSVGNGGLQHFLNDTSSFFLRERQDVQSLIHLLATDQIGYQAALVYRQAHATENSTCFRHVHSLLLGLLVGRVTLEGTRQSKFAQLVTYHLVGDVHGHVLLTVVHGNGQTDEIGQTPWSDATRF